MNKIAINGFGRIGRNVLRAYFEQSKQNSSPPPFEIVAINDLADASILAHLIKFDTVHGELPFDVTLDGTELTIAGKCIQILSEGDPANLPWEQLGIDLVMECTGLFTQRHDLDKHLVAGAKYVLLSAPGKGVDATIVYGVNQASLGIDDVVVSNASCTTNCLAPVAAALNNAFGIEKGLVNTVHAFTNDQRLLDVAHSDPRRARAAGSSLIPSKTGAAAAIGLVIPELEGRLDGMAIRVPVPNVSVLDLTLKLKRPASVQEINAVLQTAANSSDGVLAVNKLPLVSSDFNHNPASSIVDLTQTMVIDDLVKILAWYDNEWGFSSRMLDTAGSLLKLKDNNEGRSKAA